MTEREDEMPPLPPPGFWTGSEAAVAAAEAAASAVLAGRAERRDGVDLDPQERHTTRWAIPAPAAAPGVWFIPALPGMAPPADCQAVWTDPGGADPVWTDPGGGGTP